MALDAHRFGTEDQHDIAQVDVLARRGHAALRGVLAREVGRGGDDAAVPRPGRQRVDPALGPADERGRRHQRRMAAVDRGKADHRQTHVVVERQPADSVRVSVQQIDRQDHLRQVGADRPVGDLDADRMPRRPEVYCRWEMSSASRCTATKSSPAESGTSSMVMTCGRGSRPIWFNAASTAADAADVVRTTVGRES